jgi:hypothetical protein
MERVYFIVERVHLQLFTMASALRTTELRPIEFRERSGLDLLPAATKSLLFSVLREPSLTDPDSWISAEGK